MTAVADRRERTKKPSPARELDGRVDTCACPDCGMPMSIRLWLRTAYCLRCGTSIALEYLSLQPDPLKAEPPNVKPKTQPLKPAAEAASPTVDFSAFDSIVLVDAPPILRSRTQQMLRSLHRLLACLLSVLAHLLLLILLALITWGIPFSQENPAIELSVQIDEDEREGGIVDTQVETAGFDLPAKATQQEKAEAERWAKQLSIADAAAAPNLPPLDRVEQALKSDDQYRRMLSARDPRIRREILKQEGGTNLTEAAVAKALRWMAIHQSPDGSWSLDHFHRAGDCRGQCGNRGHLHSDEGATALVLQAMLGAGQTHRTGLYRDTVGHALQFLVGAQSSNGSLTGQSDRQAGLYVHALGTIALADAYALTGDETLREPAQRALGYLAASQHSAGGWRYRPGERGDLSVTGWQLMALHSGRAAGLKTSPQTFARASRFLDQMQTQTTGNGSQYSYMRGRHASPAMSAEGLLSRLYLGWKRDEPGLRQGIQRLTRRHPVDIRQPNIYYWYYATQLLHHWGGDEWKTWNRDIAGALVNSQVQSGHAAGSWELNTPHGHQGGRLYTTVLATCTLEVYYRHAPLFRKIKID